MKIAIFSDIHGNIFALEECFKYIENMDIDQIIWCGDYITDIPKSHETIQFIKEKMNKYKSYIIKGNREQYIIDYENSDKRSWTLENRNGQLLCAYNSLTKDDIDFISNLPESMVINLPNKEKIYLSHLRDYVNGNDCNYKIFGHSHEQYIFSREGIKYINPGSVGIATSGKPAAEFAILQIEENYQKLDMYSIKYDFQKAINAINQSDISNIRIKWGNLLIKCIKTGEDVPRQYINEVRQIALEHGIDNKNLDEIPIEIWDEAMKKFNN